MDLKDYNQSSLGAQEKKILVIWMTTIPTLVM